MYEDLHGKSNGEGKLRLCVRGFYPPIVNFKKNKERSPPYFLDVGLGHLRLRTNIASGVARQTYANLLI